MSFPGVRNTGVVQGASFAETFTWKAGESPAPLVPVDLTGYTADLQVRASPDDAVLMSLSSDDGEITLGGELGTIVINGPPAKTVLMEPGVYAWDLRLTAAGDPATSVTVLLAGKFTVRARITQ